MVKFEDIEDRNRYVFELWRDKNLSYKEISEMNIPSYLSLKRVRNIIYSCNKENTPQTTEIYKTFKSKFKETEDVKESIMWAYKNQPPKTLSERTIRRIICNKLNKK